jgi:hypothetical protein
MEENNNNEDNNNENNENNENNNNDNNNNQIIPKIKDDRRGNDRRRNNQKKDDRKKNNKKENNKKEVENISKYQKIEEESLKEYEKFISYINLEESDKKNIYNFLLYDLIPVKNNENRENIDLENIIYDPSFLLHKYFEKISNKINFMEDIQQELINKKKVVEEKIKECNQHMNLINKFYKSIEISNVITLNKMEKLLFNSKKVLVYPFSKKINYSLSEIFARYIFTSIRNESKNNNNKNIKQSKKDVFYEDSKLNSFMSGLDVDNFKNIDNNFKYWFFLIIIISNLFSENSDYELLTNEKKRNEQIQKLIQFRLPTIKIQDKQGEKGKDDKKKGQDGKKKGKDSKKKNFSKGLLKIIGGKKKKKGDQKQQQQTGEKKVTIEKQEKSEDKKKFEAIFDNCFITPESSLKKIYFETFNNYIRNYFEQYLYSFTDIIKNPFDYYDETSNIKIKELNKLDKINEYSYENSSKKIQIILSQYDIFQSLRMYNQIENKPIIDNFLIKLNKKLVIYLYLLYKIKKKIYESFIKLSNTFFKNIINVNNESNFIKNIRQVEKKEVNIKKEVNKNVFEIDQEIKKLQKKIEVLDKENTIKSEKEILLLKNKLNELFLKKFYMIQNKDL